MQLWDSWWGQLNMWLVKKKSHCHSFYALSTRTTDSEGLKADFFKPGNTRILISFSICVFSDVLLLTDKDKDDALHQPTSDNPTEKNQPEEKTTAMVQISNSEKHTQTPADIMQRHHSHLFFYLFIFFFNVDNICILDTGKKLVSDIPNMFLLTHTHTNKHTV